MSGAPAITALCAHLRRSSTFNAPNMQFARERPVDLHSECQPTHRYAIAQPNHIRSSVAWSRPFPRPKHSDWMSAHQFHIIADIIMYTNRSEYIIFIVQHRQPAPERHGGREKGKTSNFLLNGFVLMHRSLLVKILLFFWKWKIVITAARPAFPLPRSLENGYLFFVSSPLFDYINEVIESRTFDSGKWTKGKKRSGHLFAVLRWLHWMKVFFIFFLFLIFLSNMQFGWEFIKDWIMIPFERLLATSVHNEIQIWKMSKAERMYIIKSLHAPSRVETRIH